VARRRAPTGSWANSAAARSRCSRPTGRGWQTGWWPDLAAARRVVHVTQGTWDNADLDRLIGPAIRGLAHDDVLVVVSTGGRPASAVPGPVPVNVRIAEFLAYELLLPSVDAIVTNGGYSGVQHTLSSGCR
jgi:UDP:flavonoid glycosyltransferase YjiC (YdhE family)